MTKEEFREALKEIEERFSINQTLHVKKIHTMVEDIQKELKQQNVSFEERIGKTEADTKWKIEDVEKLLAVRATVQQMEDLAEKIKNEAKAERDVL